MSKSKRNILMCNERLDIGGVETAVLTLCKGYIDEGCNVFVAAKKGIFNEKLEKMGVKCLDLEYEIANRIPYEKMDELEKFCIDNEITEVHFHQYPCILYWLPVCMKLRIPYLAYVHSIVPGAPQWFMRDFPIYKIVLPMFFEQASRIICISEFGKNETQELFNIDDSKYKIVPNSLCLSDFKNNREVKEIKTFGIVSRLSEEKETSIKNAIDLFKEYSKEHKGVKLLIAGDGDKRDEFESYADSKDIEFKGALSDIPKFLDNVDVLMGVDRCILEAMAMNRLAIISGYNGSMNIVNKNNIKEASLENFSGKNLDNDKDVLEKLNKLDMKKYKEIVKSNYDYVNKNYNVSNNLYREDFKEIVDMNYEVFFKEINEYNEKINSLTQELNSVNTNNNVEHVSFVRRVLRKIKRIIKKLIGRK